MPGVCDPTGGRQLHFDVDFVDKIGRWVPKITIAFSCTTASLGILHHVSTLMVFVLCIDVATYILVIMSGLHFSF